MIVYAKKMSLEKFSECLTNDESRRVLGFWFDRGFFAPEGAFFVRKKEEPAVCSGEISKGGSILMGFGPRSCVFRSLPHICGNIKANKNNEPNSEYVIYYCLNDKFDKGAKHPNSFCCVCGSDVDYMNPSIGVILHVGVGAKSWCPEHAHLASEHTFGCCAICGKPATGKLLFSNPCCLEEIDGAEGIPYCKDHQNEARKIRDKNKGE